MKWWSAKAWSTWGERRQTARHLVNRRRTWWFRVCGAPLLPPGLKVSVALSARNRCRVKMPYRRPRLRGCCAPRWYPRPAVSWQCRCAHRHRYHRIPSKHLTITPKSVTPIAVLPGRHWRGDGHGPEQSAIERRSEITRLCATIDVRLPIRLTRHRFARCYLGRVVKRYQRHGTVDASAADERESCAAAVPNLDAAVDACSIMCCLIACWRTAFDRRIEGGIRGRALAKEGDHPGPCLARLEQSFVWCTALQTNGVDRVPPFGGNIRRR